MPALRRSCWPTALLAAALLCAGCGDGPAGGTGPGVRTLLRLYVEDGRLKDTRGRDWQLRGVNARIEGLFDVSFDDGRTPLEPIPEFTAEDARLMAAFGFDFLRLPINWSGLEPREGEFDEAYLARLDRVVGWARDAGLYVLVDFHQDAYSKEIGEDGAPLWAIVPPPDELLEGPLEDLEARRLSAQVFEAFIGFFENQQGVQDRFLPAWRLVAERYAGEDAVAGFQPMNEPVLYHLDDVPLRAFYAKAAAVLRQVDPDHALWVEPDSARNFTLSAPVLAQPFPDDAVVYCPHLYPRGMDADSEQGWKDLLGQGVADMRVEAESWGAALVVGEWGSKPGSAHAETYVPALRELFEDALAGQAFWLWKEHTQGFWGFFDHDLATGVWTERQGARQQIGLPYALAVPGTLVSHRFDREALTLRVEFQAAGGEGPPLLFLPPTWFPGGAQVRIDGTPVRVRVDAQSHRAVVPWSGGAGRFALEAAPSAPLR